MSNYGKYFTKKVNKSYGTLCKEIYVCFKRFDNQNTKTYLIDEQLLIKLVGPCPSKLHEV